MSETFGDHSVHFNIEYVRGHFGIYDYNLKKKTRLIVERSRWKFGSRGHMMHVYSYYWPRTFQGLGHSVYFTRNWAIGRNRIMIKQHGRKFEPPTIWGICKPVLFTSNISMPFWRHSVHLFQNWVYNSKTDYHRESGHMRYAHLYSGLVILWSFGAIFSNLSCNSKMVHRRVKRMKVS